MPHTQNDRDPQKSNSIKGIMVGPQGVGKTQLAECFCNAMFKLSTDSMPTQLYESHHYTFSRETGQEVNMQLVDTSGNPNFSKSIKHFYNDKDVVFLCFALNSKQSFDELAKWNNNIDENVKGQSNVKKFLVGTKKDLENERQVTFEDANAFAKKHGFSYSEVSANDKISVDTLFKSAVASKINPEIRSTTKPISPEKLKLINETYQELLSYAGKVSGTGGTEFINDKGVSARYPAGVAAMLRAYQRKSGDDLLQEWHNTVDAALKRGSGHFFKRLPIVQIFYEKTFPAIKQALQKNNEEEKTSAVSYGRTSP
jgi:small GTP-binding protein